MSGLVFLHPWILAGLAALPLLWFLLRIVPPAPKRIPLPSARFLDGLIPDRPFPSRTPWWILLLRMLILGLILTALAGPVLHPGESLPGRGPVRIIIDNGWEAAQTRTLQTQAAQDILARAERENRPVILLATAPSSPTTPLTQSGVLSPAAARAELPGMAPLPWPSDLKAAQKAATKSSETKDKSGSIETFYLSSGLTAPDQSSLFQTLQSQGSLSVLTPSPESLPVLLAPAPEKDSAPSVRLIVPDSLPTGVPLSVQAMDGRGRVLDRVAVPHDSGKQPGSVSFDIPLSQRNAITRFQISGRSGAGAVLLPDEQFRRRGVGILAPAESSDSTPLVGDTYYLKRALEPFATLTVGPVADLMKTAPSLILVPDTGMLPPTSLEALEKWVKAGGTLMRFSGPKMAAAGQGFLLPGPLRDGGRALGGGMSWTRPLALGPFPADSPFADLPVPGEVTVKRQVLAQDSDDPAIKIWMRLSDGTPLMTARALDRGLLVLVHTTAGPDWSDLALSGLYVDLLRRMASLSVAPSMAFSKSPEGAAALQPRQILDGNGALVKPGPDVRPIAVQDFEATTPSPAHPPGLYGTSATSRALNLGERIKTLLPAGPFPSGVETRHYGETPHEKDLMPALLALSFCLFVLDWAVALVLSGVFSALPGFLVNRRLAAFFFILIALAPVPAFADAQDQSNPPIASDAVRYAGQLHLAYVKSGDSGVDSIAENGLKALAETLRLRTSVNPGGVAALDPEKDDLSFFPLLYWPVAPSAKPLSGAALSAVQSYLNHGGTILFDTRDQGFVVPGFDGTTNTQALRRMIGSLDVPQIVPVPENHVIGRTFYLLDHFPGRYEDGKLWVESQSVSGRDSVSSVLIGGNDWAAAWAQQAEDPTSRRNELAIRFGVNLVMYALTGNYKADQVHVPHILERLGRRRP